MNNYYTVSIDNRVGREMLLYADNKADTNVYWASPGVHPLQIPVAGREGFRRSPYEQRECDLRVGFACAHDALASVLRDDVQAS